MKLRNKRIISLILAFVMLFSMVPMTAFATEETEVTEFSNAMEDTGEIEDSEESEVAESSGTTEETEVAETTEATKAKEPEVIHEHDYEAVVTDPTCTDQGYTTYTCVCGDSYVADLLDAIGHSYKNGICTGCGEEDTDGLDLNGLNVLCLGDSITAGQGLTTATRWTNVLASKYGWNLTNKSQGGISLSSYYYTTNGKSDVSIAKKAEVLKNMTTKPDVIIVWGGHNDTSYRYSPLGTWDDETKDSFKGALKYIAELAEEYAPDATLFMLTPLWVNENPSTLKVPANTSDNNWMFVDAIYEGADIYGWIPINMDLCGITPFTKSDLLLDSIHPNEAGTEKIVEYLSEELACYGANSKKETIIFNKPAVSMKPGESTTLKAVLSLRSGTGTMTFTWSSSDSSVATVDTSGKITAVAPGTAVITATAPNGISADISVSVVCEHTYEPSVTAPACTEQGYTTYTCECGDSYVDDYVDANGHSYKGITCTVCDETHPSAENYEGKVISILGDSISTFEGYIPKADGFNLEHLARYPQDNLLKDVNETWWMQVITCLDAKLGINDSWRGATVSGAAPVTTGTTGENASMANLTRIQNLGSNGTPDIILFYGGTNDLAHVSKVGSFDSSTAPTTVDLTTKKWDNLADGYVNTLLRLQYFYPDAQIVCLLPTYTTSYYSNNKLAQGNEVLADICEHYGVSYVDLRECGIDISDLPDGIHPGEVGMDYISNTVIECMLAQCKVENEKNIVYTVAHKLENAESSLSYYKGISEGKPFIETITGNELNVTVTMDGVDITSSVYEDGKITINAVTGNLVITASAKKKPPHVDYLQQLPKELCAGMNLWKVLEHDKEYYTVNGWGVHSSGKVYSVTIPVKDGDYIYATSFNKIGQNGGTVNGVRVTWFAENDILESVSADNVYTEFSKNGYLSAPKGAVAVNVPMWNNGSDNELYILNRDHSFQNGICAACGEAQPGPVITQQPVNGEAKLGERYMVEVKAEGKGLKYQWYFRNAGTEKWYKSSVKDNTYDDIMTKARAGRDVYCVITDANGNSVTTEVAKLIAIPSEKLEIITQPVDGGAVLGEKYCVNVEAKGDSLKYQWYFRNANTEKWYKSSVKDNTYDDIMTKARAGREIYCVITDAVGNSVTTDIVELVRIPVKLEITSQPADATAHFGETFCATVEAKGDGLKYQWYYRNAGSDTWHKSGVRDNTYDDVMTKARNGREIYCVITDQWGNSITTDTAKLIAVPSVELKVLSQSYESAALGERYCATVETQGEGLTFQWYFRNEGTKQWYKSSVRDNTYDDVMTKARANRDVYCIITDAFGNQVTTEVMTIYLEK